MIRPHIDGFHTKHPCEVAHIEQAIMRMACSVLCYWHIALFRIPPQLVRPGPLGQVLPSFGGARCGKWTQCYNKSRSMAEIIQFLSVALEAIIAVLCLLAAMERKYLYGFVLTFAIYVWYDLARFLSWNISSDVSSIVFLVGTLAALYSVWSLFRKG